MNYVYLATAVVSLAALGVLHKVADHCRCRPEAISLFLFICASAALAAVCVVRSGQAVDFLMPAQVLTVAAVCGGCAGLAILNFQQGVRFGNISTSWLIINLSTALPTALSVWVYHERVTWKRGWSLLLATVALTLLWLDRRRQEQMQDARETPNAAQEDT
jgi:drug/metabolite transporter (DMT)-like permease